MRDKTLMVIGLLLMGLAGLWFLTPVSEIVLAALRPELPGTRGVGAPTPETWEFVNIALNALFGGVGILLAARGYRLQSPPPRPEGSAAPYSAIDQSTGIASGCSRHASSKQPIPSVPPPSASAPPPPNAAGQFQVAARVSFALPVTIAPTSPRRLRQPVRTAPTRRDARRASKSSAGTCRSWPPAWLAARLRPGQWQDRVSVPRTPPS